MTDLYVHVGLAKTGTTAVQRALETCDELPRFGLSFPGPRHHDQRLAAYDLLGRRIRGDASDRAPGAFPRLVAAIDSCSTPRAVVSEELLALARPRQVRRLARAVDSHSLSLVVSVRDLGRTLVSSWQQEVRNGKAFSWREYAEAVRGQGQGGSRAGVAFWLRHDVFRVLDAWESVVPRSRVHLVTVPPPGTSSQQLMVRFADVLGVPPDLLAKKSASHNASWGAAQVELLRRLNEQLGRDLNRRPYLQVVSRGLGPGVTSGPSRELRLPAEDLPWITQLAEDVIDGLASRGYQVHGDLADLLPTASPEPGGRRLDDVTDAELLAAAERGLTSLALAHGHLVTRHRRVVAKRGEKVSTRERASSSMRATGFRVKESALEASDRSRVLGWIARQYLRLTSGRRHEGPPRDEETG